MTLYKILLAIVLLALSACGGGNSVEEESANSELQNRARTTQANVQNETSPKTINDINVTSITLVSRTRVSQHEVDYVLRVTFRSSRPYTRIRASATYRSTPAVLTDSSVFVGDLQTDVAFSPDDTITLRAPGNNFSLSFIRWTYAPEPLQSQLASISISAEKLLLTGTGQRTQVTATMYGADGRVLEDQPLVFFSTASEIVSVTAAGELLSHAALGSAQIYATADGIKSNLITIAVTKAKQGAILLDDRQIIGEPSLSPFKLGNRFQVALLAVPNIQVGSILISTGSKSVSGKVRQITASTGEVTNITLEIIPLHELFEEVEIGIRSGDGPALSDGRSKPKTGVSFDNIQTTSNQPSCEWDDSKATALLGEIKVQLQDHSLTAGYDLQVRSTGIRLKASVDGDVTVKFRVQAAIGANVTAAYTCKFPLPFSVRAPLPGVFSPISLVVTPTARAKAGFAGSFVAASGYAEAVVKFPVSVGLAVDTENVLASARPILDASIPVVLTAAKDFFLSEPALTSPRLISNLTLGIGADIGFAPTTLPVGSIEVASAFVGAAIESKFASQYVAALDGTLESGSATKLFASMEQGADLADFLKIFAKAGQGVDLTDFAINLELAEWESPKALSVRASKRTFRIGDNVEFRVQLDPKTLTTLFGSVNNVAEITVYKLVHATAGAIALTQAYPSAGQTDVRLNWTADYDGSLTDVESTLFAFVVPTSPPIMGRLYPFPLGKVVGATTWDLAKDFTFTNSGNGDWTYSRCQLVARESGMDCDISVRDGLYNNLLPNGGLLTWNHQFRREFGVLAYNPLDGDLHGAMTPWGFVNILYRAKQVYIHPGVGHTAYVNWLSPGGRFRVNVTVTPVDGNATGVIVRLLQTAGNGGPLGLGATHSLVNSVNVPRGGSYSSGDYIVDVPQGESLGFGVSDGGDYTFDTCQLIVTIEEVEPTPLGVPRAPLLHPTSPFKAIVGEGNRLERINQHLPI